MGNQSTYLEVKRSKVKVTRPINAYTVNVQYLPNRKAYELQTWYTDAARRLILRVCFCGAFDNTFVVDAIKLEEAVAEKRYFDRLVHDGTLT